MGGGGGGGGEGGKSPGNPPPPPPPPAAQIAGHPIVIISACGALLLQLHRSLPMVVLPDEACLCPL